MRVVAVLMVLSTALYAQTGAINGVIVAGATGEPLSYGIVSVEGTMRSMFTNELGRFAFGQLQPGRYVVRVKRLGFSPRDVTVQVNAGANEPIRIELTRVAVRLTAVDVREWPVCRRPGLRAVTDSTLLTIVSQLRLNAEQLRFMSAQYPFEYLLDVNMTRKRRVDGDWVDDQSHVKWYQSKTRPSYRPGEAVRLEGGIYKFRIPELQDVTSPQFLSMHCWHYGGIDTVEGKQVYRVDVVASETLRSADINGSFLIDVGTFQIRRTNLQLSREPARETSVVSFQMTTDFHELLPSVPIIMHVRTVQRMDPGARTTFVETIEEQVTIGYKFRGRKPGDSQPEARKP